MLIAVGPPQLSGFISHPTVPGSNPKHTIYAFSINSLLYYICHCSKKRTKINKTEAGFGQYLKNADCKQKECTFVREIGREIQMKDRLRQREIFMCKEAARKNERKNERKKECKNERKKECKNERKKERKRERRKERVRKRIA